MMTRGQKKFGDVTLNLYEFGAGEKLPMHNHDRATAHFTVCQSGRVKITVAGADPVVLQPGGIADLPLGREHEIEALDEGTRIANVQKFVYGAQSQSVA